MGDKIYKYIRLGNICKIRRGSSPRPIKKYLDDNEGMPWVKIADATNSNSRFIYRTKEYIKIDGVCKSVVVEPGDLILSNSGTIGIPMFMGIRACIHDGWQLFEECKDINRYFLYYSLIFIRNKLIQSAYDSTMKNLTLSMVENIEIPFPEMREQNKIASILSSFDEKIEVNNKIIANLEEQAQAIFKSWFVDFDPFQNEEFIESELGMIPKGWEVIQLKEYLSFIRGVEPGSKNYLKCQDNDSIPFYRVGDLLSHSTTYVNHNLLKDKISHKDDILVSFDGTVGRVRIGISGGYSSGIRKIVSKENKYFPKSFIYFLFKSDYIQNIIRTYATGTTILHAGKSIDYMQIAYNSEVINKYNQIADPIFWSIINLQQQNQTLSELRDALLPKLMSGEIDVSQISVEDEVDES